ncbi:MAG: hypothetical protein HGA29_06395, partial [Syntrophaceae bacterium]|nr:hypothetical protein [Syntrophaceae bacterium]
MTIKPDQLYELLPAIYRIRDAERGEPLKALLSVMASQINIVEEDIDQLYENWFIETCEEWLVPYIGDLLGVRPLQGTGDEVFSQRAYVANTLSYRRRKGTLAVLEELARDVTGWPAKAVEFFELLAATQHLHHLRPGKGGPLQICGAKAQNGLELLGGPFENAAYTVDVRRVANSRGKYNLPNVGLYLWRLKAYTVLRGDARAAIDAPAGCFRFHPMGYDAPLFNPPQTEEEITHLAEEINVPGTLRRLPLSLELEARRESITKNVDPVCLYFGDAPVFEVFLDDADAPLAPDEIVITNLEGWKTPGWNPPQSIVYGKDNDLKTKCFVDPVYGRLAFPAESTATSASITYSYGLASAVGGGPYDRRQSADNWYKPEEREATWFQEVTKTKSGKTLKNAIEAWNAYSSITPLAFGVIFITDSRTYTDPLPEIEIRSGSKLAIVAASGLSEKPGKAEKSRMSLDNLRPHIIGDLVVKKPLDLIKIAVRRGEFITDGLTVEGSLAVKAGNLGLLHLAHSTFVSPAGPVEGKASIAIGSGNTNLKVVLDRCITGPIRAADTIDQLSITDSLIDGGEKGLPALAGQVETEYGPAAEITRSTLFGAVSVRELYASETIFTGEVNVERCQSGCMRFSYLALPADPAESPKAPPRYRCQPSLEITMQEEKLRQ